MLVVGGVPALANARPVRSASIEPAQLRDRIMASAVRPYQGYAVSTGSAGLPTLPQLGDVIRLLDGDTQLRVWYAGPGRWRTDVIEGGAERDLYQLPGRQVSWDFSGNQLTELLGTPPVRLPRGADLVPPDLARRLLAMAGHDPAAASGSSADRLSALPPLRVAGIAAAGLRVTPRDPRSTIGQVDIWADPRTGLPLQVAVTSRGASTPVLRTRFLEVGFDAPTAAVLAPPVPRPGMGATETDASDITGGLALVRPGPLPDRLAGQARAGTTPVGIAAAAVYGTGFTQFVVVPTSRAVGLEAMRRATQAAGTSLTFPNGDGVLLSASLLSVLAMDSHPARRNYLVAGLVDGELLRQVGMELSAFRPARR
ncbi:MAG: hypothetical protein QOI74_2886 [Micromonosporaceae bacterium]|nr:hypothetical protein [Micromonosporaceae bacterium]